MTLTLMERVAARLAQVDQPRWFCAQENCDGKPHVGMDFKHARAKQTPPSGEWFIWLVLAGRGFGKTKAGAGWLAEAAWEQPDTAWAIIAPKFADTRKVCVEGDSGILKALGDRLRTYNRSTHEIVLTNGSKIHSFGAEDPMVGPRGYNLAGAWCDEIAAWRYPEVWHEALIPAIRVGTGQPRIMATTTPKMVQLVRDLAKQAAEPGSSVRITRGTTWENADNLSAPALEELRRRYAGTRLGRQELEGELLEDVEGAIFAQSWIDAARVDKAPDLAQVTVAIDPAGRNSEDASEIGIVVAGKGYDGHAYVLADRSCHDSPRGWAQRAIAAYREFNADRIIAERNYGGDMVRDTLRSVDADIPYRDVVATRGKRQRAEPVSQLYEQGRVHHVGSFALMEDQMTTWVPDEGRSPDRLDACVWALSELMLGKAPAFLGAA